MKGNTIDWLLEEDPQNPAVRYRTLVDLMDRTGEEAEVVAARSAAGDTG